MTAITIFGNGNMGIALDRVFTDGGAKVQHIGSAGEDADAESALAAAVSAGGLQAVDAGGLNRAHELEALGFLQLTLAVSQQVGWTGGFSLAR